MILDLPQVARYVNVMATIDLLFTSNKNFFSCTGDEDHKQLFSDENVVYSLFPKGATDSFTGAVTVFVKFLL